jgi:hypothetical protein
MSKETYYSLTLNATGTTESHYCSIQPDPAISFLQGGFSYLATAAKTSSVTIYPQVAQLQMPPSSAIVGSVTIVTSGSTIAGSITVSPAAEVPFTLTLYGVGGQEIGSKTLEAGTDSMLFNWAVSSANAGTLDDATDALKKLMGS